MAQNVPATLIEYGHSRRLAGGAQETRLSRMPPQNPEFTYEAAPAHEQAATKLQFSQGLGGSHALNANNKIAGTISACFMCQKGFSAMYLKEVHVKAHCEHLVHGPIAKSPRAKSFMGDVIKTYWGPLPGSGTRTQSAASGLSMGAVGTYSRTNNGALSGNHTAAAIALGVLRLQALENEFDGQHGLVGGVPALDRLAHDSRPHPARVQPENAPGAYVSIDRVAALVKASAERHV